MDAVSKKIKEFIIYKRLNQSKFAESLGMHRANFNKYFTTETKPTQATIDLVKSKYPDFDEDGVYELNEAPMEWKLKTRSLPVYDLFGYFPPGKHYDLNSAKVLDYFAIPMFKDGIGFVKMKDDAMKDLLNNGDYAFLADAQVSAVVLGEKYLIIFNDPSREPVARFIRKGKTPQSWLLKCPNPEFDDFEVLIKDVREVFAIKGGVMAH